MTRRHKLLTGLSTLTIASALAFSAWAQEGEGEGESAEGEGTEPASVAGEGESEGGEGEGEGGKSKRKGGEGESEGGEGEGGESGSEGGEGEGGEGESKPKGGEGESEGGESEGASASADPASNDVEYIRRLGLVRGHLAAFSALYAAGDVEQGLRHAKHPESELYTDLEPAFTARGAIGFAEPLAAVTAVATEGGDIEAAYAAVASEIEKHMPDVSLATRLMAISGIVTTAGDEFSIGVKKNGSVKKPHEYQDAYGFIIAAKEILASAEPAPGAETDAVATVSEQLDKAHGAFSGISAAKTEGKASTLYGAAARIEIAALGLK